MNNMKYKKIIKNKIKCKKCGDVIESIHHHDFKFCKCCVVAVDGGHDYLRRCGNIDGYEELSVTEDVEIDFDLARSKLFK